MRTNKNVRAIVIKEGNILLIHRFKNGDEYWVVPGGGVEEGESLEEALKREMKEETSLELVRCKLIKEKEHNGVTHYFYQCDLSDGKAEIGGPEKEDSTENNVYILEWVELGKIKGLGTVYPPELAEMVDIL